MAVEYIVNEKITIVDNSKLLLPVGSKIRINNRTRELRLINFQGTPEKPYIIATGASIVVSLKMSYALAISNCKHLYFEPGIRVTGGHNSVSFDNFSTDFEVNNMIISGSGFAGIMAKTDPTSDPKTHYGNFVMKNIKIHHCHIFDTKGEGMYIGNSFHDQGSKDGYLPHEIENLEIYENVIENTGLDGMQVGCARRVAFIHHNIIKNPGVLNKDYHKNGIQLSAGFNGDIFNNKIHNAKGNGIAYFGTTEGSRIANNEVINSGEYSLYSSDRIGKIPIYPTFLEIKNNVFVKSKFENISLNNQKCKLLVTNNTLVESKTGIGIKQNKGINVIETGNKYYNSVELVNFTNTDKDDYSIKPIQQEIKKPDTEMIINVPAHIKTLVINIDK